jgi:K+-transporting ATPase c subunit
MPLSSLDPDISLVRAAGIKRIARISGVQRSKVQAFVNQGATPHSSTILKIEAPLRGVVL